MSGKLFVRIKFALSAWCVVGALCLGGANLQAQDDNGGGPPPGGGPGGPPGDFAPAQFRQRMMEQMRKSLNVTNDEEWSATQPLVEKVMEARREANQFGGIGMRGPGGPGGPGGGPGGGRGFGPPQSDEQKALQKALDSHPPVQQIKDALAKYRAYKKDKQAALEAAQANLKSVLTIDQEAQAVLMGLLP